MVGSAIDSATLTRSWPPLVPTLCTPPMGARHLAVTVSVSGGELVTFTLTLDVEVPKLSVTASWKLRTVPGRTPVVLMVGVKLPSIGLSWALNPVVSICVQLMVGKVALRSWVSVPARVSMRFVAAAKSTPALTTGEAPPNSEQVTAAGATLPRPRFGRPDDGAEPGD